MKSAGILSVILCFGSVICAQPGTASSATPKSQEPQTVAQMSEAEAANNVCKVESIVFATDIKDRVPVGAAKEFGTDNRKIFCWTKLSIKYAPFELKHVWYLENAKVLEVPLRLRFSSGRLWSYKNVTPGNWRVDIVDKADKVLGSDSFVAK